MAFGKRCTVMIRGNLGMDTAKKDGSNLCGAAEALIGKHYKDNGVQDIRQVPALVLAYLGDSVYELILRTRLVEEGMSHVNDLNKKASVYAKAPTQAKLFRLLEDILTEEEKAVFKRGRNAKSGSVAKSGTVTEYRTATGFEAMLGMLYLEGKTDRIVELVNYGIEKLDM